MIKLCVHIYEIPPLKLLQLCLNIDSHRLTWPKNILLPQPFPALGRVTKHDELSDLAGGRINILADDFNAGALLRPGAVGSKVDGAFLWEEGRQALGELVLAKR